MAVIKTRRSVPDQVWKKPFFGSCLVFAGLFLSACKPEKPLHLLQREQQALQQAKAVEGMLQKQDDARRHAIDDASR